jgi:predicted nucleotidyltransferase
VDLSAPIADVIPGHRGAVLAALVRLRKPVTGRELAAQAAVPSATARRIIDDLAAAGLVHLQPTGRAIGVTLNRRHLAVPALEQLVALRAGLIERLRAAISEWSEPAAAGWLFGSAARGDGDRRSDVDIVVVARRKPSSVWDEQIGALDRLVSDITGNTAQVIDYTSARFRELVKSGNPLVRSLRVEGIELADGSTAVLGRTR